MTTFINGSESRQIILIGVFYKVQISFLNGTGMGFLKVICGLFEGRNVFLE